ncbi:MAG: hydrogenase iron-sulfur subunit [Chloroflexi bacterium]|nr:hydrogenase iron-sulfur subunit [Chloroflexota bacterium]
MADRATLLSSSTSEFQVGYMGMPAESLKVHFRRPVGRISRRQLLGMLVPQLEVVPHIRAERCSGGSNCYLCGEACPVGAVAMRGNEVRIDSGVCVGCGVCSTVCPRGAISYPGYAADELDGELRRLLDGEDGGRVARVVVLRCEACSGASVMSGAGVGVQMPETGCVDVRCLAMVSPWLILRAFDLGAEGVVMVRDEESCDFGFECGRWEARVQFAGELLERWGVGRERIRIINGGESWEEMGRFCRDLGTMGGGLPKGTAWRLGGGARFPHCGDGAQAGCTAGGGDIGGWCAIWEGGVGQFAMQRMWLVRR